MHMVLSKEIDWRAWQVAIYGKPSLAQRCQEISGEEFDTDRMLISARALCLQPWRGTSIRRNDEVPPFQTAPLPVRAQPP
jgi:hypothetical protein